MSKKIGMFLCIMVILLCGMKQETHAEEIMKHGKFEYSYTKDGSVKIIRYTGKAKKVVVPSKINGKKVRYLGEAFYKNKKVEKVKLPEGLLNVSGFEKCSNLKEINIPKSVVSIDSFAFKDCKKLKKIKLPKKLKEIGDYAFYNCCSLKEIDIPNNVKSIQQDAFAYCSKLEKVKLPKKLTYIDWDTFQYCKSLKSIVIPEGVTVIEDNAFDLCESLEQVVLPESLVSINWGAFSNCGIKEITIPQNVKELGLYAFSGCENLTNITILSTTIEEVDKSAFYCGDNLVIDVLDSCIKKYEEMLYSNVDEDEKLFVIK